MIFEPKEKNKTADITIIGLFVCAGVAFAFSSFEFVSGKGFLQLTAMALLVALVFIFVRYKLTYFRYIIRLSKNKSTSLHHEDDEEKTVEGEISLAKAEGMPVTSLPPKMLELVVERSQGRGVWTTECVIGLDDIYSVTLLPDEKETFESIQSENKRVARYKYFRNLAVPEQTAVLTDSPAGKIMVYLETDGAMARFLKNVAAYNRQNRISE